MTDEQNLFYNSHFTRYGSPTNEMNTDIRMYLPKPCTMLKPEDVVHYDCRAVEYIKALESYIEFMKLYRSDLVTRYNELMTEPFVEVVKLTREKRSWDKGKVYFYFGIYKRYLNSQKEVMISSKRYEGKQRREVIQMFNQYVKDHPAAVPKLDIEKASWEK